MYEKWDLGSFSDTKMTLSKSTTLSFYTNKKYIKKVARELSWVTIIYFYMLYFNQGLKA